MSFASARVLISLSFSTKLVFSTQLSWLSFITLMLFFVLLPIAQSFSLVVGRYYQSPLLPGLFSFRSKDTDLQGISCLHLFVYPQIEDCQVPPSNAQFKVRRIPHTSYTQASSFQWFDWVADYIYPSFLYLPPSQPILLVSSWLCPWSMNALSRQKPIYFPVISIMWPILQFCRWVPWQFLLL